ncbi:uncharacterized protein LOC143276018 [Babylonia areolata]|uniref:uncharacterized protein LOC143276018 n=1 Tax=Babylonia areolata TaxID=304850 RepID=UPI003FD46D05
MGCNSSKNRKLDVVTQDLFMDADQNFAGEENSEGHIQSGRRRDSAEVTIENRYYDQMPAADLDPDLIEFTDKPTLSVPGHLTFPAYEDEEEMSETLHIRNEETEAVFFKIKTTHPNVILVKPNRGQVAAKSSTVVRVKFKHPSDTPGFTKFQNVKLLLQGLKVHYPGSDHLPQSVWTMAPGKSVSSRVILVHFEETLTEDVDLSKFMSVQMTEKSERWWQK